MEPIDHPTPPRQRSARTDPTMRDGDASHGNPYEASGDQHTLDSDNDIEDAGALQMQLDQADPEQVMIPVDPDLLDQVADSHLSPEHEMGLDADADDNE